MSLNQFKEGRRMAPRLRSKAQIIIICVSVITLVLVVYQILLNSIPSWLKYDVVDDEDIAGGNFMPSEKDHKSDINYLSYRRKRPILNLFKGEKLIHLDLKGAPPLISYLKEFFQYIKELGATGVLIEYEDMFPYKEDLQDIKAFNAYKPSEISAILELAEMNKLSVVPLIQTFGHFEFVLKLKNYRELREVDRYPQVLCPSQEKSFYVIQKMVDQILEAHPKANYIHIGCDEVYYLGKCDKCTAVMKENDWDTDYLFLNHVKRIAQYINKTHSGVRPIMWGDMFAKIDETLIQEYQIPSLVDVMVWKYTSNVSEYITDDLLEIYARVFKSIWIASAFKGATGVNQIITDARYHLTNHMSWIDIVSKWKKHLHFKGIALTGWQRYDHFSVLCELLPVAIPSLTVSLQYLKGFEKGVHPNAITKILQCDSPIPFSPSDLKYVTVTKCDFPGFPVYQLINKFYVFMGEINRPFSSLAHGWFSVYNIVHKFSSPAYVEQFLGSWPFEHYRIELRYMEDELTKALLEIYDEHSVKEWILTNVTPLQIRLDAIYQAKEALLEQNVWPRRPFFNNTDSLQKAADSICSSNKKFGCGLLLI